MVSKQVLAEFFVATSDSAHDFVSLDVYGYSLGPNKIQIRPCYIHTSITNMNNRDPHIASLNDLLNLHVEVPVLSGDKLDGWHVAKELVTLLVDLLNRESHQIWVTEGTDLLDAGNLGGFRLLSLMK